MTIEAQTVKYVSLIAAGTARATATAAGTVDAGQANYAWFRVSFQSELNTNAVNPTVAIQQADDTNASSYSTTGINAAISTDLTAAMVQHVGVDLRGKKRYLRCLITPGTATNDTVVYTADVALSRLNEGPSGTAEMVGSTNDAVTLVG